MAEGQTLASGGKLPRLSKKLIQQHAVNNTIIVAFANANHIDYTFNWLSYIYALEISNYIIGAADATTAEALAEYDVNYFAMYGGRNNNLQQLPAGETSISKQCSMAHVNAHSSHVSALLHGTSAWVLLIMIQCSAMSSRHLGKNFHYVVIWHIWHDITGSRFQYCRAQLTL